MTEAHMSAARTTSFSILLWFISRFSPEIRAAVNTLTQTPHEVPSGVCGRAQNAGFIDRRDASIAHDEAAVDHRRTS